MAELYFVRHCEPERFSDCTDNFHRQLTAKGRADTEYVTRYLEGRGINAVISSPYLRAMQTVTPFAEKYGFRVEKAFDLSERRVDIVLDSEHVVPFIRRQWQDFDYREADGECLREVQHRCIAVVEDILERFPMGHVAIGSHGTALSTIINYYYPEFGFLQFMQLVDIMPFVAHLSFSGKQCRSIEFIDIVPRVGRGERMPTDELTLAEPTEKDINDLADICAEFAMHNEEMFGCLMLDKFPNFADWQRWRTSDDDVKYVKMWLARRKSDGRAVGTISLDIPPYEMHPYFGNVELSVRLSERWKGYGGEMLQKVKNIAYSCGVKQLVAVCDTGDIPTGKTIESAGGVMMNMLPAPLKYYKNGLVARYCL